jgi:hypothetical protein
MSNSLAVLRLTINQFISQFVWGQGTKISQQTICHTDLNQTPPYPPRESFFIGDACHCSFATESHCSYLFANDCHFVCTEAISRLGDSESVSTPLSNYLFT